MTDKLSKIVEWTDGLVHFCVETYQSASDATMACGLVLSTWATEERRRSWPKEKTSEIPEIDCGYTFNNTTKTTCPKCLAAIKARSLAAMGDLVHFCIRQNPYSRFTLLSCGKVIFAMPTPDPELDAGYTFKLEEATCSKCRLTGEANIRLMQKISEDLEKRRAKK